MRCSETERYKQPSLISPYGDLLRWDGALGLSSQWLDMEPLRVIDVPEQAVRDQNKRCVTPAHDSRLPANQAVFKGCVGCHCVVVLMLDWDNTTGWLEPGFVSDVVPLRNMPQRVLRLELEQLSTS